VAISSTRKESSNFSSRSSSKIRCSLACGYKTGDRLIPAQKETAGGMNHAGGNNRFSAESSGVIQREQRRPFATPRSYLGKLAIRIWPQNGSLSRSM
jgi:hypothetical protein